jgi:hypothetical protein
MALVCFLLGDSPASEFYKPTSAYKIQTPGNHPEENIQHTEHGESLKSKTMALFTGTNQPRYEGDHSSPFSNKVRKTRS